MTGIGGVLLGTRDATSTGERMYKLTQSEMPTVCHAATRKGTRCRRTALPGHIYCGQHTQCSDGSFFVEGAVQKSVGGLWTNGTQPKSVFHYTTVDMAVSILRSRELWLSRLDCLNDSAELSYGAKRIRNRIGTPEDTHDGVILECVDRLVRRRHQTYVFSTCLAGDSVALWQGYKSNVCLEFNPVDVIHAMSNGCVSVADQDSTFRLIHFNNFCRCRIGEVLYDTQKQDWWLDKVISDSRRVLRAPRVPWALKVSYVCDTFETVLLFFKHEDFMQEREYRVCVMVDDSVAESSQIKSQRRRGDSPDSVVVHYVKIPLRPRMTRVRSFRIGPTVSLRDQTVAINDLRRVLVASGFDATAVQFVVSESSLRW